MTEHPFSIVPNPHFLYMSERHSEALAHLNFGQGEHGGFVLLTGEVGTGKTTVSRRLIRQMPETTELAFILNPALTEVELLATVCDELGISYDKQNLSLKELFDGISRRLLDNHKAGLHTVLLIDEAQHLGLAAMEQLRLLTNLETDARKLLQVILIGQPELQQMLKQNNLRQLAQRITARYHLMPLNIHETRSYIEYRLQVAGVTMPIFTAQAITAVFGASDGIPRIINLICDRALMAAYGLGVNQVDAQHVITAANEILGLEQKTQISVRWLWLAAAFMATLIVVSLLPPGSIFYFVSGYNSETKNIAETELVAPILENTNLLEQPLVKQKVETKVENKGKHSQTNEQASVRSPSNSEQGLSTQQNIQKLELEKAMVPLKFLIDKGRDKRQAFVSLFKIWGIALAPEQASCKTALRVDLSCLHSEALLDNLLLSNSPAVVELNDENGSWFAVLFEVDMKLHLLVGEHAVSVTRSWFEQHWQGKASLFWQPPPSYIGQLMVGGKGRTVQWLETSLAKLEARKARSISRFDDTLQRSVQAFQQQQNLIADGIAGVQTLIKLRQALNETLPRLTFQKSQAEIIDSLLSIQKTSASPALENLQ